MDNERDNLPSASAVARLLKCAASHRMALSARAMRQEAGEGKIGDEWRERGTAMHHAIFNQTSHGLETDQERQDYSKIMLRFREFLKGWGAADEDTMIREERMWLHDGIDPIFSGRPDYIRISKNGKRAAIVEFKSLWNKEDQPADNPQLWSQAVLLAEEQPQVMEFTMQIVSPHYVYRPHLATRSEIEDYDTALRLMLSLIDQETEPVTGEWCKHCPGLLICPKVQKESEMRLRHPSELDIKNAPKLLERLDRLERFIKECREYYKLVLAKDPESIPGWGLMEKQMRILGKPEKLYGTLYPFIGDEFWKSVSVSITKLEATMKQLDSNPPADLLAPFITIKHADASLVRKKK